MAEGNQSLTYKLACSLFNSVFSEQTTGSYLLRQTEYILYYKCGYLLIAKGQNSCAIKPS